MRLGIVSDSHGHLDLTQNAVRMLESLEVDAVLHCGDIGSPEIIDLFAPWPTDFVQGNCDYNLADLALATNQHVGHTFHGLMADLQFETTKVAMVHSHERSRFLEIIRSKNWPIVCYGHTHVAKIEMIQGVLVLNPGAIYRANPPSIGVIDLPSGEATLINL